MSRLDLADGLRLIHQAKTGERFGHEAHLTFAWSLLEEAGDLEEAERVANLTIRHVAEVAGSPGKYHCTVTLFWMRILDHVRRSYPDVTTITEALDVFPDLGDPHLPDRHWSDLDSAEARLHWVEPDLLPMP